MEGGYGEKEVGKEDGGRRRRRKCEVSFVVVFTTQRGEVLSEQGDWEYERNLICSILPFVYFLSRELLLIFSSALNPQWVNHVNPLSLSFFVCGFDCMRILHLDHRITGILRRHFSQQVVSEPTTRLPHNMGFPWC